MKTQTSGKLHCGLWSNTVCYFQATCLEVAILGQTIDELCVFSFNKSRTFQKTQKEAPIGRILFHPLAGYNYHRNWSICD